MKITKKMWEATTELLISLQGRVEDAEDVAEMLDRIELLLDVKQDELGAWGSGALGDMHERLRRLEAAQPGSDADNAQLRTDHEALELAYQAMQRERDDARKKLAEAKDKWTVCARDLDKAREELTALSDYADRIDALEATLAQCEAAESVVEVRRLARAELGKVNAPPKLI